MNLQEKYNLLQTSLGKMGNAIVAYSGGVDSTFLLKAAVDALGSENVLACIGVSASLARSQYDQAIVSGKIIGANIRQVNIDELTDCQYSANKADRCFHCKSHLFDTLSQIAEKENYKYILCGSNFDDKDDFRPGNRAAIDFGIVCPLADAELTKDDIRRLSADLDLPTADMPASPCLASRISYGLEITEQRLKQVEQAEDFLRQLGLVEFRVRHHDQLARIEVHSEDIEKVTSESCRQQIVEKLKSIGFKYITIDMQGFRSGSLNETLTETEKKQSL